MPETKRPNVLFLTTDQQRLDGLGINNPGLVTTPAIDELARQGANFTNFFVNNPVCMPTRACVLTGRRPHCHGVRDNGIPLPETEVTLAHCLSAAGYRTANLGKLHFLPHSGRDHAEPHPHYGFDVPLISDEPGCYPDPYIRWIRAIDPALEAKVRVPIPNVEDRGGPVGRWVFQGPEEYSYTAWVADRTIEFVRGVHSAGRPWFAIAGFYLPHSPCNPPQHYLDMYPVDEMPLPLRRQGELDDKPRMFQRISQNTAHLSDRDWQEFRAYYYATCSFVDHHCARILKLLDELGIVEDTIVVFHSDHGDLIGDHWMTSKHATNYDGIIRVPLIIRWPGLIPAGRAIDGLVESVDVMPTTLEAAGLPIPEGVNGQSQWSLVTGEASEGKDRVLVEYTAPRRTDVRTVRTKEFKYSRLDTGEEVLIDLTDDPDEFVNRAADPSAAGLLSDARLSLIDALMGAADPLPPKVAPY